MNSITVTICDDFLSTNMQKLISKSSIIGNHLNDKDVAIFRKILEVAMSQGRWFGAVSKVS